MTRFRGSRASSAAVRVAGGDGDRTSAEASAPRGRGEALGRSSAARRAGSAAGRGEIEIQTEEVEHVRQRTARIEVPRATSPRARSSRVAQRRRADEQGEVRAGAALRPAAEVVEPQSSAASPSIHSSGREAVRVLDALAVAVMERVEISICVPAGHRRAAPLSLRPASRARAAASSATAASPPAGRRRRYSSPATPFPLARPSRPASRAPRSPQARWRGWLADRRERAQGVRRQRVADREQPVRASGRRAACPRSAGAFAKQAREAALLGRGDVLAEQLP